MDSEEKEHFLRKLKHKMKKLTNDNKGKMI